MLAYLLLPRSIWRTLIKDYDVSAIGLFIYKKTVRIIDINQKKYLNDDNGKYNSFV
jgi:hypothetical protein